MICVIVVYDVVQLSSRNFGQQLLSFRREPDVDDFRASFFRKRDDMRARRRSVSRSAADHGDLEVSAPEPNDGLERLATVLRLQAPEGPSSSSSSDTESDDDEDHIRNKSK